MEGISKKTVGTSKLFRFLVGPDKEEFTIHSDLVAHQSPVLNALVHGRFSESSDYSVKWDDIDECTFISFWQYVYTGDYDTPERFTAVSSVGDKSANGPDPDGAHDVPLEEQPEESEPIPPTEEPGDQYLWAAGKSKKSKKKRTAKQEMLWEDFQHFWHFDLATHPKESVQEAEKNPKAHANALIHHAEIYIFGDRYAITRLMEVSLHKLHRALTELDLEENRLGDITALLRACYLKLAPDKLRRLVVHYTACKVESLWKSQEFHDLLDESRIFSKAVIETMLLRLD